MLCIKKIMIREGNFKLRKTFLWSYIFWIIIFIFVPIVLVCYYGFTQEKNNLFFFSLDNFSRAFKLIYIKVFFRSIVLALICTLICFLIGYPVAYILAEKNFKFSSQLLFLFLVPMWMNMLLRTYAWFVILENNGLINFVLSLMGLKKISFLYNNQAIVLGMVYNFLPFMILPIYNSLKKIDLNIIEAAQDLGANAFKIFIKIILPLSLSGIFSGVTMVFMPAVTSFIISNLLGGGKFMLIGNLIEQEFLRTGDWHFGCALSIILIIIIFCFDFIFRFGNKKNNNDNYGGSLF